MPRDGLQCSSATITPCRMSVGSVSPRNFGEMAHMQVLCGRIGFCCTRPHRKPSVPEMVSSMRSLGMAQAVSGCDEKSP